MHFDRVAVIGISGSGKSTFASALAAHTGLPLLHGDQLEWLADWTLRPEPDLKALHAGWIEQPRWIIEGWMEPARVARLIAADIVIDLDLPRSVCAWRVLVRMVRGERRTEMPIGCVDRFSWRTLRTALLRKERPYIDAALKAATIKNYVRLCSRREAANWLTSARECWHE
jgi:adenylate kinase family enzyme